MRNSFKEANSYIHHLWLIKDQDPDSLLRRSHKITTDQQNLIELISAAKVLVGQLDDVALPDELRYSVERLGRAIRPCDISQKRKEQ